MKIHQWNDTETNEAEANSRSLKTESKYGNARRAGSGRETKPIGVRNARWSRIALGTASDGIGMGSTAMIACPTWIRQRQVLEQTARPILEQTFLELILNVVHALIVFAASMRIRQLVAVDPILRTSGQLRFRPP